MLGDRVIYTRAEGDEYAAIIAKVAVSRPDDRGRPPLLPRVQLAVFMPESKTWYSYWIAFDAAGAQNTWRWRPDGSR